MSFRGWGWVSGQTACHPVAGSGIAALQGVGGGNGCDTVERLSIPLLLWANRTAFPEAANRRQQRGCARAAGGESLGRSPDRRRAAGEQEPRRATRRSFRAACESDDRRPVETLSPLFASGCGAITAHNVSTRPISPQSPCLSPSPDPARPELHNTTLCRWPCRSSRSSTRRRRCRHTSHARARTRRCSASSSPCSASSSRSPSSGSWCVSSSCRVFPHSAPALARRPATASYPAIPLLAVPAVSPAAAHG